MRFLIDESFDRNEINHFFVADVAPRIGQLMRARSGRLYRVKDIGFEANALDDEPAIHVLLKRVE